jgi:hypothetical protein
LEAVGKTPLEPTSQIHPNNNLRKYLSSLGIRKLGSSNSHSKAKQAASLLAEPKGTITMILKLAIVYDTKSALTKNVTILKCDNNSGLKSSFIWEITLCSPVKADPFLSSSGLKTKPNK